MSKNYKLTQFRKMSSEIIAYLKSLHPIVVNSYQGAYGPPTQGHYQAMMFSAREHIRRYPEGRIVMVYMPTAKSSSKPHLQPTQEIRIQILNQYCRKLQDTFALEGILDNRILFIASRLEYELANEGKSTSTINTIMALKTLGCDVTLTMGLDNLFDLPYWERVTEYKDILANPAIYVPRRFISEEESARLLTPYSSPEIRFLPQASWNSSKLKPWESVSEATKAALEILKDRIVLLDYPLPTSSTLLRCALYKLYGKSDGEFNPKYVKSVEKLQGFPPSVGDAWHTFYQLTRPYVVKSCEPKNFNSNFEKSGLKGGRRQTRRRRSYKRRSTHRI